jgi:ABC-type tungstate transport system substrate-binding protein
MIHISSKKKNVARILGLSFLKKMIAALRTLAYGVIADFTDEYVRMGESTAIQSKKRLSKRCL